MSRRIVILTGAGISADSGVDTFRDPNGIWAHHNVEDVATPDGFRRNPARVHGFYNGRRRGLSGVQPNAAHRALARLEAEFPGDVRIVTQNVDDLHERGGSRHVIHMHGELAKVRNLRTGQVFDWRDDLTVDSLCPATGMAGVLRPHVVWFGEMPLRMDEIADALDGCDLFASIGTSGNVYPAAGFVAEVRARGHAHTVEINLEPSQGATLFAETIYGRAVDTVPRWVDGLLKR